MKFIAYYLPQFHEVEENNQWWGTGFTEWTNVKKAQKLDEDHFQPVAPLNNNYYDLMNKDTVVWQTKLSKKYNIYGFCYYHYWFEGRMILEKPAENLLKWKDIDQNFCFCWANHSWKKTWNGTNEMLIEQTYGDEKEWGQHFDYLQDFFKDDRYIKIDNKPVFMIYSSKDIPQLDTRVEFYNNKCKEIGFDGIYFLESINNANQHSVSKMSSELVLREPNVSLTSYTNKHLLKRIEHKLKKDMKENYLRIPMKFDYNQINDYGMNFVKEFVKKEKKVILGTYMGWDSTPRHKKRGYIINSDPKKFEKYLESQKIIMSSEKNINSDYIFINAWNEWTEGMYLEPDNRYAYERLEVIKKISTELSDDIE